MKILDAKSLIRTMFEAPAGKRRAIYLKGGPGIGKSDAPKQVAAELSADTGRAIEFLSLQATIEDPITLSGLPARDGDFARFLPFLDKLPGSGEGVLCIDELPTAPMAVQAGLYELFLSGKLGSYHLPTGWLVVATGNRDTDRAATSRMPTPLVSRLLHVSVEPDLAAWIDWAIAAGVKTEVIAFLSFRSAHPADGIPDIFNTFDPTRAGPYACPRTWHFASDILDLGLPPAIESETLAGTVGEGPAGELVAFMQIFRTLVSPDAILLDPDGAEVPSKPATLYAVCGALARKATAANLARVVRYLDRMPAEFSVMTMQQAMKRDATLQHTRAFIVWAAEHAEVMA